MTLTEQITTLILKTNALRFGDFTLKSGRKSPYFFNLGCIHQHEDLMTLGQCYAQTIADLNLDFNTVLGAAYKGIPIACYTLAALNPTQNQPLAMAYDRKEKKAHGEGGQLVGVADDARLILIDDVITAGTAMVSLIEKIRAHGQSSIAAIVVALNRQEKTIHGVSASQWIQDYYDIPVYSLLTLDHLINHLPAGTLDEDALLDMQRYRAEHAAD